MSEEHGSVKNMWTEFLNSTNLVIEQGTEYEAYSFSDDKESANELARLVREGKKRATSSLYYFYELEEEELPDVDDYSIILDWDGVAQCIIRNVKISVLPFNQITEEYARSEGEGDMSLEYWRKVHKDFFIEELREFDMTFSEEMKVVCEEFEVVFCK